jgi:tetratricopeptide (TPR) repeat protein
LLLVLCSRADGDPDEPAIAASGDASVDAPVRHAALERLVDSLGRWLTRIDLGRLPPADAAWLAAQYLPGAREGLAAQVAEEAGGVPLFIAELALHVQIAGTDGGRPVSFVQLVRRRVAELPDDARELVELVAVSGEPISQRVAATSLGVPPESLGRAVRHLRAVNLAQAPGGRATDRIECFHSRIRECVRAQIGGERVRACHRALALALEQWSEGSSAQLARHWKGAGDEARAGEHARAAADEAARHFDFHRAARFYEMALGAGVGRTAAERHGLRVAMAEALASAGRPAEAAAAFREAADLADPVTALALRHRSAMALLRGGHVGEGLAAIEAVLRQIEPAPTDRRGAQAALAARLAGRLPAALRSRLGGGRLGGLARRWLGGGAASTSAGAVGEGDVPGRVLTEMDVCGSMAVALALVDPHRGAEYQARFLSLALHHPEPHRLAMALVLEAGYRAGEGRYRRAERLAGRAERVIAGTGDERLTPYALWVRGALAMTRDSAWRAALDCFRQAAGLLRQQERASSWEMSISEQYISLCRLSLGELGALAETMPASVRAAELRGDRYAALSARLRFGTVLHLLRGDPGQAARDLDDAVAAWAGQRGRPVGDYAATIARADLCLYTGRPADFGALARLEPTHLARSRVGRYPMALRELAYAGGRIAVALGAVEPARGHAALLRRDGAPASVPLARLLDAGLAARAGDRRTAVAALAAALGELDRLEMAAHAAATRRALGLLHGSGGRDLVGEADAAFRAQGVAEPARFAAMMVVGTDLVSSRTDP